MKKLDNLYNWYVQVSKGILSKDEIKAVVELLKPKVKISTFEKFTENMPEEEKQEFQKFLVDYGILTIKPGRTSAGGGLQVTRINSLSKYNSLMEEFKKNGEDVPLGADEYLELTNAISEAQVKLNSKLRPVYELRVYIHKRK